jgi:RHH-type proline utilization regulon transcriptional repressor/proline dehydrogenase/delta 1-pyrroline-5-carboxylate dehydrogenase
LSADIGINEFTPLKALRWTCSKNCSEIRANILAMTEAMQRLVALADLWLNVLVDSTRAIDLCAPCAATPMFRCWRAFAEYGLSTQEGVALMCDSAAAYTRCTNHGRQDAPHDWSSHSGLSSARHASTWVLMLTGEVLDDSESGIEGSGGVIRLGEPVIRKAMSAAMRK